MRVEQVVAPHHLAHALVVVVDHHRHLVGGRPVGAAHHEVVDDALDPAMAPVVDGDQRPAGPRPPRRTPPRGLARRPLARRQVAARAGVGALGQGTVGRGHRFAHLAPRAVARVQQPGRVEAAQRLVVAVEPVGLPHDLAVAGDAERGQVGEVGPDVLLTGRNAVEVVDANEEGRPVDLGGEPGQHRGAEVAHVERPRRAGGEAAGGHVVGGRAAVSRAA